MARRDDITFGPLQELPLETLLRHMSDPRIAAHLPLLDGSWDLDTAQAFLQAKAQCWQRDGLGHWAIYAGDDYIGWGGFQHEEGAAVGEWDFGLVLQGDAFGHGPAVLRAALDFARGDTRISEVSFLLAPSRRSLAPLTRLGAIFVGTVSYDGADFQKYRLPLSDLAHKA